MSVVDLVYNQITTYPALKATLDSLGAEVTKVVFPAIEGSGCVEYEIPAGGAFLKLPPQVDFNGWTIVAKNLHNYKWPLFSFEKYSHERKTDFHLTKADVDAGNYSRCAELCSGRKMLVLKDQKEWTYRTDRNDMGPFFRHDVIALNDGVPDNRPIAPWNTPSTALSYYYYEANTVPAIFENLTLKRYRDTEGHGIAKLIRVDGKYDVTLRNINVQFVEDAGNIAKTEDACFEVYNSAHVRFENIQINGTYSSEIAYGYAFYLDNVFDVSFRNVHATGLWGVIGTRNLNRTFLKDCQMNRFDIHCYGRDVRCVDCVFDNVHFNWRISCDYSSFFGTLHYERCTFRRIIPVFLASDYHAYSGFDLVMDSCTLDYPNHTSAASSGCDAIIVKAGCVETPENKRPEFQKTEWPNVHIVNLTLTHFSEGAGICIFYLLAPPENPLANTIGHITQVSVNFSSAPATCVTHFSNYSENLIFDNTLTLKSTNADASFVDM